jgi:transcriptional regulator with GAF, ATPase, and Fis domain
MSVEQLVTDDKFGLIFKVTTELMSLIELKEVLQILSDHARIYLGVDAFWITLTDSELAILCLPEYLATENYHLLNYDYKNGKGLGGLALKERKPVQVADYWQDPRIEHSTETDRRLSVISAVACMASPIFLDDELKAVLGVAKTYAYNWTDEDTRKFEQISTLAKIAIQNDKLRADVKDLQVNLINQNLEITNLRNSLKVLQQLFESKDQAVANFINELSQSVTVLNLIIDLYNMFDQPMQEQEFLVMQETVKHISDQIHLYRQFFCTP